MSSAAAASCVTRYAARKARGQCVRKSASRSETDPRCAPRTRARSSRPARIPCPDYDGTWPRGPCLRYERECVGGPRTSNAVLRRSTSVDRREFLLAGAALPLALAPRERARAAASAAARWRSSLPTSKPRRRGRPADRPCGQSHSDPGRTAQHRDHRRSDGARRSHRARPSVARSTASSCVSARVVDGFAAPRYTRAAGGRARVRHRLRSSRVGHRRPRASRGAIARRRFPDPLVTSRSARRARRSGQRSARRRRDRSARRATAAPTLGSYGRSRLRSSRTTSVAAPDGRSRLGDLRDSAPHRALRPRSIAVRSRSSRRARLRSTSPSSRGLRSSRAATTARSACIARRGPRPRGAGPGRLVQRYVRRWRSVSPSLSPRDRRVLDERGRVRVVRKIARAAHDACVLTV